MQPVLHRRFDMVNWFKRHGFPVDDIVRQASMDAEEERAMHARHSMLRSREQQQQQAVKPVVPLMASDQAQQQVAQPMQIQQPVQARKPQAPSKPYLLLSDFDKTLTDFDAGGLGFCALRCFGLGSRLGIFHVGCLGLS